MYYIVIAGFSFIKNVKKVLILLEPDRVTLYFTTFGVEER